MKSNSPQLHLSHPTGNANVRQALMAFMEAGMLRHFYTSIGINAEKGWVKFMPESIKKELFRRQFPVDDSLMTNYSKKEWARLILPKLGIRSIQNNKSSRYGVDAIYTYFDRKVSKAIAALAEGSQNVSYTYEDAALSTFGAAKQKGMPCIYDLPIGYWKAAQHYLLPQVELLPDWASTLTGLNDSETKLAQKDAEIALSDAIIVASTFTKNTLNYYSGQLPPVFVVPYGFPSVASGRKYETKAGEPLKVLFVGGLSQRKGLAHVLEAAEALKGKLTLTLIGKSAVSDCAPIEFAKRTHRYIPSLPHEGILSEMKKHDVLVFPSLFEGFGLVITEAMSQGTPVITTDRTCGPDLISHNQNGWLIDAGSTDALTDQLRALCDQREMIERAGNAAMDTAHTRPWSIYRSELVTATLRALETSSSILAKR